MRVFLRFIYRAILLLIAVGCLAAGVDLLNRNSPPVPWVGTLVAGYFLRRSFRRRAANAPEKTVPATIMRIWCDPRPGAPNDYWTYVLFDSRGERIRIHLERKQVADFIGNNSEGDTGQLTYSGDRMHEWQVAAPGKELDFAKGLSAFVSYSHDWREDAEFVAQFLRNQGMKVWLDTTVLGPGMQLADSVADALGSSDYFVPLLSADFWSSEWCIKEIEAALDRGITVMPVKVTDEPLAVPPHLREKLGGVLDETVYVDLRGRNPIQQLRDLVHSMVKRSAGKSD